MTIGANYSYNSTPLVVNGRGSAVGASAYRRGTTMTNEVDGAKKDYSAKADEVVHTEIGLPSDAPAWVFERYGKNAQARLGEDRVAELLWNDLEMAEVGNKRKARARVARSIRVSLPTVLSAEQRVELVRDFVEKTFTSQGLIADWVIHYLPERVEEGRAENPHAHILVSTRHLTEDGFGLKNTILDRKSFLHRQRFEWAAIANYHLEKAGFDLRMDHRSLKDQGLDLRPVAYDDRIAGALEARGILAADKARKIDNAYQNEIYLMANPEHILLAIGMERQRFTREDVEVAVLQRVGGAATGADVLDIVNRAMSSAEVIDLGVVDIRGNELYSTRSIVAQQATILAGARRLAEDRFGESFAFDRAEVMARFAKDLKVDSRDWQGAEAQVDAVENLVSSDRLGVLIGFAGTGKSHVLGEVSKVWEARGYQVLGGAISGKATQELIGKGIPSASLAQWQARWAKGDWPREGKFVFIMDEAGMVGGRTWIDVQQTVERMGGKFIVAGDGEQLQPVMDMSVLAQISEMVGRDYGSLFSELSYVRRQKDIGDRVMSAVFGRVFTTKDDLRRVFEHYQKKGSFVTENTIERALPGDMLEGVEVRVRTETVSVSAFEKMAHDYWEGEHKERLALAYRNVHVDALNRAIRAEAVSRGIVEGDGVRLIADQAYRPRFKVGERLTVTEADAVLGLMRGDAVEVLNARGGSYQVVLRITPSDVDPATGNLRASYVMTADVDRLRGLRRVLDPAEEERFIEIAKGDRVRFAEAYQAEGVARSAFATVLGVGLQTLVLRIDESNRVITVDTKEFAAFDHGYAATVHKSQGMSVNGKVFGYIDPLLDKHLLYVMFTRHVHALGIYADDRDLLDPGRLAQMAAKRNIESVKSDVAQSALPRRFGGSNVLDFPVRRVDYAGVDVAEGAGLVGDGHLSRIALRVAGLLKADFKPGMALVSGDVQGFAQDPFKVVETLLSERSVITGHDVASRLSEVVQDPDTFLRLFTQAMSHPDLVVLEDDGSENGARVYTTTSRFALEASLMDRAMGLAWDAHVGALPEQQVFNIIAEEAGYATASQDVTAQVFGASRLTIVSETHWTARRRFLWEMGALQPQSGGQVYVLSKSPGAVQQVAKIHPGLQASEYADFMARAGQEQVRIKSADRIVLIDAGQYSSDEMDRVMALIEASGAKLVLHTDHSKSARGSIMRHLAARIPVAKIMSEDYGHDFINLVNDPSKTAEDLANLIDLKGDVVSHSSHEDGVDLFVERYLADETKDKRAIVGSRHLADQLNQAVAQVESARARVYQRFAREGIDVDALTLVAGQPVVVMASQRYYQITKGQRGRVIGFGEDGRVEVLFDHQSASKLFPADVVGRVFGHGYVTAVDDLEADEILHHVHTFLPATTRSEALTGILRHVDAGPERAQHGLHVTAVHRDGGFWEFIERVQARGVHGSVLDYGFDPSKALAAAAEAYDPHVAGARVDQADLDARALRGRGYDFMASQPDVFLELYGRGQNRFGAEDLERHVERHFVDASVRFDRGQYLERLLASNRLVEMGHDRETGSVLYATRTQLEVEAGVLAQANRLAGSASVGRRMAIEVDVTQAAGAHVHGLVQGQQLQLAQIEASDRGAILGGTIAAYKDAGVTVIGLSASREGAERLGAEFGIDAKTIAGFDAAWRRGDRPERGRFILFVDGAGSLGTGQYQSILPKAIELDGSVLAVTHSTAPAPIGSLDVFAALEQIAPLHYVTSPGVAVDETEARAAQFMRMGGDGVFKALRVYQQNQSLRFAASAAVAERAIARGYWREGLGGADRLAIVGSKRSVAEITGRIRNLGVARGYIVEERIFGGLGGDPADAVSEAPGGLSLGIGDRVRFVHGALGIDVLEGARGVVVGFDAEGAVQLRVEGRDVVIGAGDVAATLEYGYADTFYHARTAAPVDHAFVLVNGRMGREDYAAALNLHRVGLELHIPRSVAETFDDLVHHAQRSRRLDPVLEHPSLAEDRASLPRVEDILAARADRIAQDIRSFPALEHDAHLMDVGHKMSSLLGAFQEDGDPLVLDKDHPMIANPQSVVDTIVARQSVLRASDVAGEIAKVVRDPVIFNKIYIGAMSHPDLVVLAGEADGRARVYSTRRQIEEETSMVDSAVRLAASQSGFKPNHLKKLEGLVTKRGPLSRDQERAYEAMLSGQRLVMIEGLPGTGKSTVLNSVRSVFEDKEWRLYGATLSADAAQNLQDASGIRSYSLAGLLSSIEKGFIQLDEKTAIVIDEFGQLDTPQAKAVIDAVEAAGATLFGLGDRKQGQPYGYGAPLVAIQSRTGYVQLNEVHRQRDPGDAQSTADLHAGGARAREGIQAYKDKGGVIYTGDTFETHVARIADAYVASQFARKMVTAPSNADVTQLNAAIRARLVAARSQGVPAPEEVHYKRRDGSVIALSAGDEVAFRAPNYDLNVKNGMTGHVIGVDVRKGRVDVELHMSEGARVVGFTQADDLNVHYGYAMTIDRSQGKSWDETFQSYAPYITHDKALVSATRHIQKTTFFVTGDSEEKAMQDLDAVFSRERPAEAVMAPEHGFDIAAAFTQALKNPDVTGPEAAELDRVLNDYLARHDANARPAKLSGLASKGILQDTLDRARFTGDIPHGAWFNAYGDVLAACGMSGETAQFKEDLLPHKILNTLVELGRRGTVGNLMSDTVLESEDYARVITGCGTQEAALPEARLLARALFVAREKGDEESVRIYEAGLDNVARRVSEARKDSTYMEVLKKSLNPVDGRQMRRHMDERHQTGRSLRKSELALASGAPKRRSMFDYNADIALDPEARGMKRLWDQFTRYKLPSMADALRVAPEKADLATRVEKGQTMKQSQSQDLTPQTQVSPEKELVVALRDGKVPANKKLSDAIELAALLRESDAYDPKDHEDNLIMRIYRVIDAAERAPVKDTAAVARSLNEIKVQLRENMIIREEHQKAGISALDCETFLHTRTFYETRYEDEAIARTAHEKIAARLAQVKNVPMFDHAPVADFVSKLICKGSEELEAVDQDGKLRISLSKAAAWRPSAPSLDAIVKDRAAALAKLSNSESEWGYLDFDDSIKVASRFTAEELKALGKSDQALPATLDPEVVLDRDTVALNYRTLAQRAAFNKAPAVQTLRQASPAEAERMAAAARGPRPG